MLILEENIIFDIKKWHFPLPSTRALVRKSGARTLVKSVSEKTPYFFLSKKYTLLNVFEIFLITNEHPISQNLPTKHCYLEQKNRSNCKFKTSNSKMGSLTLGWLLIAFISWCQITYAKKTLLERSLYYSLRIRAE